jgi:hypothetical protein
MSGKSKQRTKPHSKSREQRQAEMQTLVLWGLLANGGEGFGNDLKPEVNKPEREALLKAGLISVEKRKRAYWLSVTDRGWRWAEDHLSDTLPDRSYAGTFILAGWLERLQAFMRASNTPLAEILVPKQDTDSRGQAKENAAGTATAPTDYGSLRERIRAAYLALTGGSFNKRALLADIRRRLPDVDRDALDDALVRMQRQDDATLMQLDNRPDITQADREAAIQIGQESRHIVWISR